MRNPKFALLQGVMMVGRTSVVDDIPTACTNGRDEKYGRKFVAALTDKELAFLVAHEVSHKMYRHLTTWKKLHDQDHSRANKACDYVINLMLRELDPNEDIIAMPKFKDGVMKGERMGLYDPKYKGMNSKQVFDLLEEKEDEGGGGGGGIDDHDWDGAQDMTEEEKKTLEREIDQAIRQGLMAHEKANGKGAGGVGREINDHLQPQINWREELREYVKATCHNKDTSSWRRVNRRFLSTGTYMPSMIGEKVGHIVVGIDTSGSIGGKELDEFLAEVKGVAEEVNPEIVDLIYWDGEVAGHEKYEGSQVPNIVSSTKPCGGGGTDPSCVSKYLRDENIKPECVIVLTDGYVPNWGSEWTAPTMWVITGGNDAVADNGKTIHIKD
jgi:predicted metal-dependent peptidase